MNTSVTKWKRLGIVPYGSHIDAKLSPSAVQRVRLFMKYGMRCIIVPQHFMAKEERLYDRELALYLCGFAIDNGAYICHLYKTPFPEERFLRLCNMWGNGADWIAIPDVVGNGSKTLDLLPIWIDKIKQQSPNARLLLVWQDGITKQDILPYIEKGIGVFVGGTTEAKLKNMSWIARLCIDNDVYCHIGRVNSERRVRLCRDIGANSFDGSGWSRFICTLMYLERIIQDKQMSLFNNTSSINIKMLSKWITTQEQREKVLMINKSQADEYLLNMNNINSDGIGLPKGFSRKQYPILWR